MSKQAECCWAKEVVQAITPCLAVVAYGLLIGSVALFALYGALWLFATVWNWLVY